MAIMSLEDMELRLMAKRANQRLVSLEKTFGKDTAAAELAEFYIGAPSRSGKYRFPENPTKLSEDQKADLYGMLTNFLNDPYSNVKAERQRRNLIEEAMKSTPTAKEEKTTMQSVKAPKNKMAAVIGTDRIRQEKRFWKLFNYAKEQGLNKRFDYRTVARAISNRLARHGAGTMAGIRKAIEKASREENFTRRRLEREIANA